MEQALTLIYTVTFGLGVVYAIFQLVTQGAMGDLDFDTDGDFGVSMLAISWFVSAFGASGLLSLPIVGALMSIFVALGGGILLGAVAQLFVVRVIAQTQSTNVQEEGLVGKRAEISTPIPANGLGQITFVAGGGRMTYAARATKTDMTLPRGQSVTIVRIAGSVAHVEPLIGDGDDG